jgi:hypothetical protein
MPARRTGAFDSRHLRELRKLINQSHDANVGRRKAERLALSPTLCRRRQLARALRSAIEGCRRHNERLAKSVEDRAINYVSSHSLAYDERRKSVDSVYATATARREELVAFDEEHDLQLTVSNLPPRLNELAVVAMARAKWDERLAAMRARLSRPYTNQFGDFTDDHIPPFARD